MPDHSPEPIGTEREWLSFLLIEFLRQQGKLRPWSLREEQDRIAQFEKRVGQKDARLVRKAARAWVAASIAERAQTARKEQPPMSDDRPPIQPDKPIAGFYKRRLVSKGPFVAVQISRREGAHVSACGDVLEPETGFLALLDGKEVGIWDVWPGCARYPITEAEYRYMRDAAKWDRNNDPTAPAANPRQPIDLGKVKPVF